jgi:Ulp1 family protease
MTYLCKALLRGIDNAFLMPHFHLDQLAGDLPPGHPNSGYGFDKVKKWVKGLDLAKHRYIFWLKNLGNIHWILVFADLKKQYIQILNSMGADPRAHTPILENVLRWLSDLKGYMALGSNWQIVDNMENVPRQHNGWDCGIYSLLFAFSVAKGAALSWITEEVVNRVRTYFCAQIWTELFRDGPFDTPDQQGSDCRRPRPAGTAGAEGPGQR